MLRAQKNSLWGWALILGYLFWGKMPTPMLWGGTALIIASGIAVLYEQHDATR